MPILRSATRQASTETKKNLKTSLKRSAKSEESAPLPKRTKRVNVAQTEKDNLASKTRPTNSKTTKSKGKKATDDNIPRVLNPEPAPPPLPAVLSFAFEEAKSHLISTDPRFEDIFEKLECRPFQHLESVDPFRTLTTSILGQQISWLAARSITHKFRRLFDPSLPEKPDDNQHANESFPTAYQVATMDSETLRTAGLSRPKDLATRFADGRLSNEKILDAQDEELYELLTGVLGIGRWTVDMFAIFSLRRPNILPVGDLGVQRGIALWALSLHSTKHPCEISPKKLSMAVETQESQESEKDVTDAMEVAVQSIDPLERAKTPDVASFPPGAAPSTPTKTKGDSNKENEEVPLPPPAFTPSINRTLNRKLPPQYQPAPLPEGLSVKELQARLDGKKKIKGSILTPTEMSELTKSWEPYRSLGVYYMWSLSSAYKSKSK